MQARCLDSIARIVLASDDLDGVRRLQGKSEERDDHAHGLRTPQTRTPLSWPMGSEGAATAVAKSVRSVTTVTSKGDAMSKVELRQPK